MSLDPDQVVLRLSATINYHHLPCGITALESFCESYPKVQITYAATEPLCTLSGSYSQVQAVLAQLLDHLPQDPGSADNKEPGQSAANGSWSVQPSQKHQAQVSDNTRRKPHKEKKQEENNDTGRTSTKKDLGSKRDLTPGGYGWEDGSNTEAGALQPPPTFVEDFTLIVDADLFQYLERHCRTEYHHILSRYNTEVIPETNQGVTTLFLKVAETAGMGERQQQECLKLASEAISQLYQENETMIRRSQVSKSSLSPRGGLQLAVENLRLKLPKLLLNEDEKNIYIIGRSSDVSEAKLLLLDCDRERDTRKDEGSLLRYPLYDSGSASSSQAHEEQVPHGVTSTVGSWDLEDEGRADGAKKYKLAARFKDSGMPALGSRFPTDFSFRTNPSPSRQTGLSPLLGYDGPSAVAQNTGEDILFRPNYALVPPTAMQNKTSLNKEMDTKPKNTVPPFSTSHSKPPESASLPPPGSGSTLKRASSFSGTLQQKTQVAGQKSLGDASKSSVRARGRSSSFSSLTGRDKHEVHNAEISVSSVMWDYIKDAYQTRVEDLTSDVQVKESGKEGSSKDLTIVLKGANSAKLTSCQQSLQKLVDSVSEDFYIVGLRFSELGVTDEADATLQACCSEIRSRFKKVTVHISKEVLYLVGPKQLCSKVGASLREVFKGEPGQHLFSNPPYDYSPGSVRMSADLTTGLHLHGESQVMQETQSGKAAGNSVSQDWKTTYRSDFGEKEVVNGSVSQSSVRKEPVIKEKVNITAKAGAYGQKLQPLSNHSMTRNDAGPSPVNGTTPKATKKERTTHATKGDSTRQRHAEIPNHPEESRLGQGGQAICNCEQSMAILTKCGLSMCPRCLETQHHNCSVCHETDQTPRGLRGDMKTSRLQISLPGHIKDLVIKITYRIPDGIQGDNHPSPGKPFKGGLFEAYLPDSANAKKLIPRLLKAFKQGLTFTVTGQGEEATVIWGCIPHKTSTIGGKAEKGYPDSSYLTRLSAVLNKYGIE
ncbi:uncharacterized protein si:busm1-163l24.3 [Cololabis saira]|uniref:uncharacterized protein si:busm1-163l24.3 n=1 Tax=Cololabis saira TaxID=129043 RepID=UPI002AD26B48|nr:uncharacterized protein si:busm1-163l24.3 [Cololabis saira]